MLCLMGFPGSTSGKGAELPSQVDEVLTQPNPALWRAKPFVGGYGNRPRYSASGENLMTKLPGYIQCRSAQASQYIDCFDALSDIDLIAASRQLPWRFQPQRKSSSYGKSASAVPPVIFDEWR